MLIDMSERFITLVAETAYEEGGKQATRGEPWSELADKHKTQVLIMVEDVLAATNKVLKKEENNVDGQS